MITLPDLPYPYDALKPVISEVAMRLHHDKHQARYVDAVNACIKDRPPPADSLEDLIRQAAMAPDRTLYNNAAQAWNHAFFWNAMTPQFAQPSATLAGAVRAAFGDFANLRTAFIGTGLSHFGSGWVWLVAHGARLSVFATHDAETVLTRDLTPLLVCDLWEHAYYLDHHNDRAGYLSGWWDKLANWRFADAQFAAENGGPPAWRHPTARGLRPPVIADRMAYEIALEDAIEFMDHPPHPGTVRAMQFAQLLEAIARFQSDAPTAAAPPAPAPSSPLQDLERRITAASRAWVREHPVLNGHWSPLIGGDWRES